MSRLVELMESFDLDEGFSESPLTGVRFFKALQPVPRMPLIYDPGICIVAQGSKIGYLGGESFQYDANNYLVVSVTMPFECETFASPQDPVLGVYIDVDMAVLNELISHLGHSQVWKQGKTPDLPRGIGPAPMDGAMVDATVRLLTCLQSKTETQILGPALVREVLFRALCGSQAHVLHALASHDGNFARVARALQVIHNDYGEKLDVDQLASQAFMSTSAFHRAFKEVTSDSPMQYLKKFRLTKARDFLVQDGMKAYMAADKVGYDSPSQFSREFKRHFGLSPADVVREYRAGL